MGVRELIFAAAVIVLAFWAANIVRRIIQRRAGRLEWLLLGGLLLVAGYSLIDAFRGNEYAQEWMRRARCKNNLKQIRLAMLLYAEDYDGWFPTGPEGTDASYALGMIAYEGAGYLRKADVFTCPSSDETLGKWPKSARGWSSAAGGLRLSSTSYVYLPGFRISDPPHLLLIVEKRPDQHPGGRHVLFINGDVRVLGEAEFQARVFGQLGWNRQRETDSRPPEER